MNETIENMDWLKYVETPIKSGGAVKLDRILAKRLKAFIKAKKVKSLKLEN